MQYEEMMRLNSGGGALLGVALTNYAAGQLGFLKTVISVFPGSSLGFIAVNAAGGVAVMNLIGGAPLDERTVAVAGVAAVAYRVAVGMLSTDMQNKLNGSNQ